MLDPGSYDGTYEADAGHLSLDFTNTLGLRTAADPHEWLHNYANLVAWGEMVGAISEETGQLLLHEMARDPAREQEVLAQAIAFREAIFRIFSASAAGFSPETNDVNSLNAALSDALIHLQIIRNNDGYDWDWHDDATALNPMLWPVVRSAADLLTAPELSRVGECPGEECGWLFLDMSRNHSRKWCNMGDCGNREKARRHYQRVRASHPTT